MVQKHVQVDKIYQSHQLPTHLDTNMWNYSNSWKNSRNPPPKKKYSQVVRVLNHIIDRRSRLFLTGDLIQLQTRVFRLVGFLEPWRSQRPEKWYMYHASINRRTIDWWKNIWYTSISDWCITELFSNAKFRHSREIGINQKMPGIVQNGHPSQSVLVRTHFLSP